MTATGDLVAGRYRLQRALGEDADTTTWAAFDTALDRQVVLKQLRPDLASDPRIADRFLEEVRAAARSSSGPRVLDAGLDRPTNTPFAVFEWADGSPAALEEPAAAARPARGVSASRPRPGRAPRGAQWFIPVLLLVPLAAGAMLITSFMAQTFSFSVPQVLLPRAPGETVNTPVAATTTVASQRPVAQPTNPVPTPAPASPRPTLTTGPSPSPTVRRRISNTDGLGVALRASPGGDRLPGKGYDEGVTVTVLEQQGAWAHIRGDDGREGWVLAVTVVP